MSLLFDLRVVLRGLLRRPGYALTAILTLALGIGANAAVFSVIHGSLLRPLPYEQPDRLLRVEDTYTRTGGRGATSVPNFMDLRERSRTLTHLVGYVGRSFNLSADGTAARARGLAVTSDFLEALGVRPFIGRGFEPGEDRAGTAPVVVLTHRVWLERFGGSRDVLGRSVDLHAQPHTVVGVLPEGFWFPGDPQFIVPFNWDARDLTQTRGSRRIEAFARLAPGVSQAAAQDELRSIFAGLEETYPGPNEGWSIRTRPLPEDFLGYNRGSLLLLSGAALLVLLVGCVNVANLMLVRSERGRREFALRAAIGAGRSRLARHFFTESALLALLAAGAGIGVAWAGVKLLLALYGGTLPRADQVGLNLTVLGFAVALAVLTSLLVGLAPTLRTDPRRLYQVLRESGGGAGTRASRLQRTLVVADVALAVVLVAGAGLLINSFWRLNRVDVGIDTENALAFHVELPPASYDSEARIAAFFERALVEIGRLPGVLHAGISDRVPTQGGYNITTLASPDDAAIEASFVEIRRATPGFFPAAGIPLLAGRLLTEDDARTRAAVVVISDELARTLFPAGNAIGKRIDPGWDDAGYEIVGVVGSVREFGVLGDKRPALYWPYPVPNAARSMVFVVRTRGEPLALVPTIRAAVAAIDPNLPLYGITTLEEASLARARNHRVAADLFTIFGALALALAAIGIFGVLAFIVEQRTREIGIRMALGATRESVARLVVRQGMRLVAVGLVVGVAGALAGSRLLADLLFEVSPMDPLTLAAVAVLALAAAALASYLPARRASRVQPASALRME